MEPLVGRGCKAAVRAAIIDFVVILEGKVGCEDFGEYPVRGLAF